MKEMINNYFIELWNNIWYYASFQFVDPFWWWLIVGIIAIAVITAIEVFVRFYFADLPWLRKLGGFAVIGIIWGLFVYSKAEKEARAHDAKKHPPRKDEESNNSGGSWGRW